MDIALTSSALEERLGARLRELRLLKNVDQKTLAERAGLSLNAVKHLESGKGTRVNSLVKVLCAMDKADWLETLAPTVSVSPMQMLKNGTRERKRTRRVRVVRHSSELPLDVRDAIAEAKPSGAAAHFDHELE